MNNQWSAAGTYSGIYLPSNSIYSIVVQADNSTGAATYTWNDILPSATDTGEIGDITPDTPVSEAFNRTASFQIFFIDLRNGSLYLQRHK